MVGRRWTRTSTCPTSRQCQCRKRDGHTTSICGSFRFVFWKSTGKSNSQFWITCVGVSITALQRTVTERYQHCVTVHLFVSQRKTWSHSEFSFLTKSYTTSSQFAYGHFYWIVTYKTWPRNCSQLIVVIVVHMQSFEIPVCYKILYYRFSVCFRWLLPNIHIQNLTKKLFIADRGNNCLHYCVASLACSTEFVELSMSEFGVLEVMLDMGMTTLGFPIWGVTLHRYCRWLWFIIVNIIFIIFSSCLRCASISLSWRLSFISNITFRRLSSARSNMTAASLCAAMNCVMSLSIMVPLSPTAFRFLVTLPENKPQKICLN